MWTVEAKVLPRVDRYVYGALFAKRYRSSAITWRLFSFVSTTWCFVFLVRLVGSFVWGGGLDCGLVKVVVRVLCARLSGY